MFQTFCRSTLLAFQVNSSHRANPAGQQDQCVRAASARETLACKTPVALLSFFDGIHRNRVDGPQTVEGDTGACMELGGGQ